MNMGQALKERALRYEELYLKLCTVDSVDEKERTISCTPVEGAKLISVDLQAMQEKTTGLLIVPKIGSKVVVGYLDKNNAAVLLYTDIDKIVVDVENTVVINGGENNGLVKIAELHNRLKSLENAFNNHVHPATTTATIGAATTVGVITINPVANGSNEFQSNYSGYENEKIKH
jgi:hypothetical protein